jgi:hypothetical protein
VYYQASNRIIQSRSGQKQAQTTLIALFEYMTLIYPFKDVCHSLPDIAAAPSTPAENTLHLFATHSDDMLGHEL